MKQLLALVILLVSALLIGRAFILKAAPYTVSPADLAAIVGCMRSNTCANTVPRRIHYSDPSDGSDKPSSPVEHSQRLKELGMYQVNFVDGSTHYELTWTEEGKVPARLEIWIMLHEIFKGVLTDCRGDGVIDEGIEEVPGAPVHTRKHFRAAKSGCSIPGIGEEYRGYMQRLYYNSINAAKRQLLK